MKMRAIAVLAIFSLVACGEASEGDSDSSTSTQPPVESSTTTPSPESKSGDSTDDQTPPSNLEYPESEMTDDLLDAIVADAAEHTGVDLDDVEIVSVTDETFNDSSLGCPEPGQVYTQVITPGHIVIVQAGGAELDYRVGTQPESFKLCE